MLSMRTLLVVLVMGVPVGLIAHDTADGTIAAVDVASVQPADPAGRAVDDSAD